MKLLYLVQCHLCPIKWICDYCADEESYKWTREIYGVNLTAELTEQEHEKLQLATQNCPIKKLVGEANKT